LVPLAQALICNENFANTLFHLDLSKNPGLLGGDEASNLYTFLAGPNVIAELNLSGTDCIIDVLFGALLRGCCAHLTLLDLSGNVFSHRRAKETLPSFRSFFSNSYSLTHLNFSGTKLPSEALRALFQGLGSNKNLDHLQIDLSRCELRSSGAQIIQETIGEIGNISNLDISDNGFDADMLSLLPALAKNKSIRHLSIGKNFNAKPRILDEILQATVQLFQDEDCSLQSLSIANSKLKTRISVIINALGSNTCLTKVDLSGNAMNDIGLRCWPRPSRSTPHSGA
ncbi:capping protein, Arp2/3 and myosin-I linker protein 3-like, partial [Heptranchias perlo]|uniref:capping protein, Arp2/3 and myosin-I linker protein 3-like n=1 Tax=Heptranchias perlo TaxID=212740 RepID=UPI003559CDCE